MSNMPKSFRRLFSLILAFVLIVGSTGLEMSFASGGNRSYTIEDLSAMDTYQLIDVLSTTDSRNISGLFEFSEAAYSLYCNRGKMEIIIDELRRKGQSFTKDDDLGIPTMVEFVRAAFFLGYQDWEQHVKNNKDVYNRNIRSENERIKGRYEYLNNRSYREKLIPVILEIQNNPNFGMGTKVQDDVVKATGALVGGVTSSPQIINNFTPILRDFSHKRDTYLLEYSKIDAYYGVVAGVRYDFEYYLTDPIENEDGSPFFIGKELQYKNPRDSEYYGKIDGFIEALAEITQFEDTKDNTAVLENALYTVGKMGLFHRDNRIGNKAITDAFNTYEYLSRNYIYAARQIASEYYKGINYYGEDINFEDIREKAMDKYYGKIHSFDNGRIIIRSGDKVRTDKLMKFYWSAKEVEAQYFRSIGSDEAIVLKERLNNEEPPRMIKPERTDNVLTMIIYNDIYEYGINLGLNEYDTNNGGLYIKEIGTLYTYERSKKESRYTVEELIRHEYTHYLQGRYVSNAEKWGHDKFYDSNLMDWYEEGGAEYFAGSSRTEGVLPRKSVISSIESVDKSDRYSLSRLLNSTYSDGNELYGYAYMFMDYSNKIEPEVYDKLTKYIMNDNFAGFKAYVERLEIDERKDMNYKNNIDYLMSNKESFDIPKASDIYLAGHKDKNTSEILQEVQNTTGLRNLKHEIRKSDKFDTIEITGKYYSKQAYGGELQDKLKMDKIADDMLKKLSNLEWSGYDTFTIYFKNYEIDKNYNFNYDVVLHGIKSGERVEIDPEELGEISADIVLDTGNITNEVTRFSAWNSKSENGEIVSYKWVIDGKEYEGDYVDIMFENPGDYDVKLMVTDEVGLVGESELVLNIKRRPGDEYLDNPDENDFDGENKDEESRERTREEEPNNNYKDANLLKGIKLGETNVDDSDCYYFEIVSEGDYTIELEQLKGNTCAYSIYRELDTSSVLYYPTEELANKLSNRSYYYPGKYYVRVYGFTSEINEYSLELK